MELFSSLSRFLKKLMQFCVFVHVTAFHRLSVFSRWLNFRSYLKRKFSLRLAELWTPHFSLQCFGPSETQTLNLA